MKSDVDSHIPEKNPVFPRCQLSAKYLERMKKIPNLVYSVSVDGAKDPLSYFVIDIDPYIISSARGTLLPLTFLLPGYMPSTCVLCKLGTASSTSGGSSSLSSSGQFSGTVVPADREDWQERRVAPAITELHQGGLF